MQKTSLLITTLIMSATVAGCGSDTPDAPDTSNTGPLPIYNNPESALWDVSKNGFYVSSVAGDSTEADGVGWISKLDADGAVVNSRWVDGLNAPKGMAVVANRLYVADLTQLLEIDTDSAEILRRIEMPGAAFLNDVTAGAGKVWISDTFGNAIYQFIPASGDVSELARDPLLTSINGILFDNDRIVGGTIGDFMDPNDLGDLVSISLGGSVEVIKQQVGKFDGLELHGNTFLATDFRGLLLDVARDGTATVLKDLAATEGFASAADLGFDPVRGLVAVPDLLGSKMIFISTDSL